ncbi:hypothetical protein CA267_015425 [Alteromonas pelagimontana]|uniref:Uncharacterized protein n=1 Tax=Alteromonas pelagimontana TaxID=1858656 RepID=A0A6M4MIW4_9ALTE|nr:hypothetical protein [Alteromonas pelagimontana]QJR82046.1 hypothetical protein CA267_015425 [Alteromonas pelagimontana]
MKVVFLGLAFMVLAGCQHRGEPDVALSTSQKSASRYHVNAPLAVFSTYPSAAAARTCQANNFDKTQCKEDAVTGEDFVEALKQKQFFDQVIPSAAGQDYELLIANQAATVNTGNWWQQTLSSLNADVWPYQRQRHYFTELTVQWRGVEINSKMIEHRAAVLDGVNVELAGNILDLWWKYAQQEDIFSASFLYQALQASDYLADMSMPASIAVFTRTDTQLYHDPFKGAIARYIHPQYDSALLDITVSPILTALNETDDSSLQELLNKEIEDAQTVANARDMQLQIDSPIQPFYVNRNDSQQTGWFMAISAESDNGDTLFATTYIFRQHDKIIKFSTTFPPRVSDELVREALPQISVPTESPFMATLRGMATQ